MAKFMSFVLFMLVVVLAAIGAVLYTQNPGQTEVQLLLEYALRARLVELLGGAFGVGAVFAWIVVWTRNLRRARKAATPAPDESDAGQEVLDASSSRSLFTSKD